LLDRRELDSVAGQERAGQRCWTVLLDGQSCGLQAAGLKRLLDGRELDMNAGRERTGQGSWMGKNWKLESGTGLLLAGKELYGAAGKGCLGRRRLKELLDGRKRDRVVGQERAGQDFWMGERWTGLLEGRELDRAAGGKRAGQGREPAEDSMELLDRRELDRAAGQERAS